MFKEATLLTRQSATSSHCYFTKLKHKTIGPSHKLNKRIFEVLPTYMGFLMASAVVFRFKQGVVKKSNFWTKFLGLKNHHNFFQSASGAVQDRPSIYEC